MNTVVGVNPESGTDSKGLVLRDIADNNNTQPSRNREAPQSSQHTRKGFSDALLLRSIIHSQCVSSSLTVS